MDLMSQDSNFGGAYLSELVRANADSLAFFEGTAPASTKKKVAEQLAFTGQRTVGILRKKGFACRVARSYCPGTVNHGTGFCLDLAPGGMTAEEVHDMARALESLNMYDQLFIEAASNRAEFVLHVMVNKEGYNPNPARKIVLDADGTAQSTGLQRYTTLDAANQPTR